jgi:hypothetical protein
VADRAEVVRGPWGEGQSTKRGAPATGRAAAPEPGPDAPRRVVLGLVVKECARSLGHEPSPRELARWANHQQDERGEFRLFGREIEESEAAVILRNPSREVTVRPSNAAARPGLGLVALPGGEDGPSRRPRSR